MIRPKVKLIPLAAFIFAVSFGCDTSPPAPDSDTAKAKAGRMSEEFVKDQLKSPTSAQFPNSYDMQVTYHGNDTYTVNSTVDSQNSFGAMMHADYTCKLKRIGDQWKCLDVQIHQR